MLVHSDSYEEILSRGYTEDEIAEIKILMRNWDKASYSTLANSIVDCADIHDFENNYLKLI
ncbi:hypothetical protein NUACC21_65340 [Scytonema sp. NUACC21]